MLVSCDPGEGACWPNSTPGPRTVPSAGTGTSRTLSGPLATLPGTSRTGLPSATQSCCDRSNGRAFHLHSTDKRSTQVGAGLTHLGATDSAPSLPRLHDLPANRRTRRIRVQSLSGDMTRDGRRRAGAIVVELDAHRGVCRNASVTCTTAGDGCFGCLEEADLSSSDAWPARTRVQFTGEWVSRPLRASSTCSRMATSVRGWWPTRSRKYRGA